MKDFSLNRRAFLGTSAALLAAGVHTASGQTPKRKKIALIGTEVRRHSHAQHFIDRFLLGYAWENGWRRPDVDLVSLYIDQFPEGDLARGTAARFEVPIYGSIAEALTLRGSELAVDGVVIIGEHGDTELCPQCGVLRLGDGGVVERRYPGHTNGDQRV